MILRATFLSGLIASAALYAQTGAQQPDWAKVETETMQHFQAVLRLDTSNPPGNEHLVVDYLKQLFDKEGIASEVFASDPKRSNFVARLKGNGRKRPLLMTRSDQSVEVDDAVEEGDDDVKEVSA